ncbi:CDP-diacylglycerol--glycerol-3-phosphate 3-phosphatidyltransferase, mitochondrial-like [Penaeus japonicus]|uniref:CDP-diacylglycerol--glycerol-3-phosphate 3-phosphatidyltransferase, mitochondrial-like n=1 Tax=Penaeus japonicus TaxID=27405 RepID=UPI001C7174D7|nr:CDP-diacylglycerol--glycerol-3-phosphate 3-phosphatidyltransferase, mitochondrial-like [Penaeus japonicus]
MALHLPHRLHSFHRSFWSGSRVSRYLFQGNAVLVISSSGKRQQRLYTAMPELEYCKTPSLSLSQPMQLPVNLQWLLQYCPAFPICGSKVRVITNPKEFYQELLDQASRSSRRISMSSLYLGTGKLEKELVSTMVKRANECEGLQVKWLLDFTRGSRGDYNSCSMLQPLISRHPGSCSVSLYHTPDLRGILKSIIPQRWNEVIGLQHMKLYVFDDTLVISGANLSNDYFTNRQDRYFVFENCPALASFYHRLIDTVSKFSFLLHKDNTTAMPQESTVHPFLGDYKKYCNAVREAVEHLWRKECEKSVLRLQHISEGHHHHLPSDKRGDDSKGGSEPNNTPDTLVFPTLQMGPFGITNDSVITNKLLTQAEEGARIQLASGYFNLTKEYMECILHQSRATYGILMAHPKANGFLGARGFAGAIPAGYTHLAKGFYKRLCQERQNERILLCEYKQPGWTFHVKGLWYYQPNKSLPLLTLIGSPNFGWRSVNRDLESQIVLLTTNEGLQKSLHQEQERLYNLSDHVTDKTFTQPDRWVPFWVRCVMPIIKVFF